MTSRKIPESAVENLVDDLATKAEKSEIQSAVPVGTIIMWGGPNAPAGRWIIANGAAISRTTYAELYAVYGTTWGEGDGNTTFNLPNCVERYPKGTTAGVYGNPTLPNLKGYVAQWKISLVDGVLFQNQQIANSSNSNDGGADPTWFNHFNASAYNSIYQDGATVNPYYFGVMWYVKY